MSKVLASLLACATFVLAASAAHAADHSLSGAVASRSAQKLEGVTVSAKLEGSTIATGVYPGPNAKSNQIMERHQKQLAAYLARARGAGESSMNVATRARPTGEAARAVWTLYDLPLNPDAGIGTRYNANDGTDWSLGTTSKMGQLPHDGALGLDGTIYFTCNNPNRGVTIGKVDPVTGAVKYLKADGAKGLAATTHGLARDRAGNLWFDINPGRRALGKLDTATEKITIYQTPESMAPVGGAGT